MAGGVGSRFWPMSTTDCPKQFIDVLGVGKSLLQLTFERFQGICSPENVWVVTNKSYYDLCKDQLPEIPAENILTEPCRRNTAPCIAYVSWRIKTLNPKANVVVTPSDHVVTNTIEFQRVVASCLRPMLSSPWACAPRAPKQAMAIFRPTFRLPRHATMKSIALTRLERSPMLKRP